MRVVTFGEAMLRFSPPDNSSLEKSDQYVVEVAGAEANVAVALARLGIEVAWVSRLPRNDLGRRIAGKIRHHGVATRILWTDEGRVGLYFVAPGIVPRVPHVIYDRQGSAFAQLSVVDIEDSMLEGADLLHLTGITPALSPGCRDATVKLIEHAERRGIRISFDVNYRSKLSSPAEARHLLERVAPSAGFLFISSADAGLLLAIDEPPAVQAETLHHRYPHSVIVVTAGDLGAFSWDGGPRFYPSIPGVTVDRFGRGDAFCAGYLVGRERGGPDAALAYGSALASLAQTYAGDLSWASLDDVTRIVEDSHGARYR